MNHFRLFRLLFQLDLGCLQSHGVHESLSFVRHPEDSDSFLVHAGKHGRYSAGLPFVPLGGPFRVALVTQDSEVRPNVGHTLVKALRDVVIRRGLFCGHRTTGLSSFDNAEVLVPTIIALLIHTSQKAVQTV